MTKLIGESQIDDSDALQQMYETGGIWAAYQNHDMSSSNIGHLIFLKVGKGCTFEEAPVKAPDSPLWGPGWRYLHCGYVDSKSGLIVENKPEAQEAQEEYLVGKDSQEKV